MMQIKIILIIIAALTIKLIPPEYCTQRRLVHLVRALSSIISV